MRKHQHSFFDTTNTRRTKHKYGRTTHGGIDSKGQRKEYRPLSGRKWIHLTLKSEKAKGPWSFLTPKNQQIIREILKEKAKKWGVQITDFANVGNHLHIKLRFKYREGFQNFLRSITSLIARKITKARRGVKTGKFWQGLAFTRVLTSGFEELQLKGYFTANRKEAAKGQKARDEFLKKFNDWIHDLRYGRAFP
jgi:REP element-mobilizing transposase RayT